ncbi:hypothetical protein [Actinomyces naeslundii]|jgi:hypothetical protein avisC_06864|uniref:Uncharacterized protein n=3 Tax=Actinomyces naeslundii TaxID=1655 RepID=J3F3W1_ACTNH|nr:hypothetical protein [Actinomyces naeslundii]EJN85337.1 hypothetical protein HMPREF1129_2803 [Actinomyces naeslundii str. Howell 279]OMG31084.1 hypothetical protein BKH35_00960 [Actinomyces naeslundii]OMG31934.1 hypothetical protein BKH34_05210 [Actinomyces naeslundii]OMG33944.1 hypothetical protein BKH25_09275 [Actinomyces naeslundii]OMG37310.1 hypothetical protein BKH33_05450 [Actinomyces naeslundii]
MVGFRKKSQDSNSAARSAGRGGAGASGAPQRSRASRTEPAARAGKGRRTSAAGRRSYKTSEQMDSRCLTLAESASGVLGRSLDQALGRLPDGPDAPAAAGGPAGSATASRPDAVGAPGSTRGKGASPGSVRSAQTGTGQVDTVADIAADIEF